ncbi:MAG: ATP-binding protein [Actinomycetaceae bacterium]|nr:ATP-binding protein [Actinomycetaceae bacterium]
MSDELPGIIQTVRVLGSDTAAIEVKSGAGGLPGADELCTTLCAFANMPDGGTLIIGLDEKAGFAPVTIADPRHYVDTVASYVRDHIHPRPAIEGPAVYDYEGAKLVVTRVDGLPLHDRPARYAGKAYYRLSDGDTEMSEQQLAYLDLMKKQAGRRQPDREVVPGATLKDLDADLVEQVVRRVRQGSRRLAAVGDDTEVLAGKGVLSPDGGVTVAGLYALGTYPQEFLPSLTATAAVQLPASGSQRLRRLQDFDGPLPEMVDACIAWIEENEVSGVRYDESGRARNVLEFPAVAVREVVANAFVHRSLEPIMASETINVRFTPSRLVVASPGGLWGTTRDRLLHRGLPNAVNPVLYNICKLLSLPDGSRLIEGEGGGLAEAARAMDESGCLPLDFQDSTVGFRVLFSRKKAPTAIEPEPEPMPSATPTENPDVAAISRHAGVVYAALAQAQRVPDIARQTGLAVHTVRYALAKLTDAGLVEMVGGQGKRDTYYRPTP